MKSNGQGGSPVLLALLSSLAFAAAANAQPAAGAAAANSASANNGELTEIVITGSRVIKNGNDSPTPVTVVSVDDMRAVHPGTVADQLNDLPEFSGSRGQFTNPSPGSQGSSPAAPNASANVLNLRNFGFTRTLVLFDGHRLAPTSPDGTVDVNMIPQLLLQRVDVVTGGASAVYGSDAVTGVVNFITDTHFNGVKVNAQTGISHYRDDRTVDVGIAGGMDIFGGKGHIEVSFENRNDPGVPNRSDRPFGQQLRTIYNPNPGPATANGPFLLGYYLHNIHSSFGGLVVGGPLNNQEFSQNGVLTPFVFTTPLGPNNQSGGSGTYSDSTLKAYLAMNQLFGRLDYDFTDAVHGYADVAGTYNYNRAQAATNGLTTPNGTNNGAIRLSSTDPFLPLADQQALSAAGPTFGFAKTFTDIPATNTETWERQYQANLGLNVKLGGGYEWDMAYSHAGNMQNTRQNANINNLKMVAALNAVVNPANNQIVCAVSLTANAALYPGCQPFNPFGPSAASQAAIDYVVARTQFWAYTTMDDVTTSVTGAPFSDWAGPVNMALSAEWRRLAYHLDESGLPNDANNPISCAGLPAYDCTATPTAQTWATQVSAPRTPVSQGVGEAALEFDAPLLKDVFLAKHVSLNAAARWTEYSTSGATWTWKAGLVWKLGDELTLRATHSRDIRAPTLNDLYLPPSTALYGGQDFVTGVQNITPAIPWITSGNSKLVPEVGITTTGGFIYTPKWLDGLSLAVDAFKIDVSQALFAFAGIDVSVQTACANSGGASAFCQLVVRPIDCCTKSVANTATGLFSRSLNLAHQWTEGADIEANYAGRVHDHPFSLRALATYQPHIVYSAPGSTPFDMGGVGFANGAIQASPAVRVSVLGRYSPFQNFTVDVLERWRSPLDWGPKFAAPNTLIFAMPRIESTWYTDLNLSYLFRRSSGSQTEVYFNVTNLFNRQPPPAALYGQGASGQFGGFVIGDDPIGAYYTVGFRYRH
jgi:iron complex outermembrane receptor protein